MKKVVVLAVLMAVALPQSAFANTIVSTSPPSAQTFETPPSAVTITTESALLPEGHEITVTDPAGARVDLGLINAVDVTAMVDLKPLTKSGIYTVTYSLLSENDVPLTGRFTFNYSSPTIEPSASPIPTQTSTPMPSGNNLGTTLFVIGLLLAALVVAIALVRYARKLYNER